MYSFKSVSLYSLNKFQFGDHSSFGSKLGPPERGLRYEESCNDSLVEEDGRSLHRNPTTQSSTHWDPPGDGET